MNLTVNFQKQGEVIIIVLKGRFIGTESDNFQKQVEKFMKSGNKIVVNLGELNYIGSQGVSCLVGLTTRYNVKLANLSAQVKNTMEVLKLSEIFEIFNTVDEAIKSFEIT
ncbi:MAG: STAS domain-containing protein [Planctomycetota bacterium]